MPILDLEILPGDYSVTKLPPGGGVPGWIAGSGLISVTLADDETSVISPTCCVPSGVKTAPGWTAIKLTASFGFDEPGVVLSVVRPISEQGAGVFVTSTFDRDYLLVRAADLPRVRSWLAAAGHRFVPHIRAATADDAAPIAAFHNRIWQQTYAQIAPPQARQSLDEGHRLRAWRQRLKAPSGVFLAEEAGQIVGLISVGAASQAGLGQDAEVKHLYTASPRTGLGRRLMSRGLAHLRSSGYHSAGLAVVAGNAAAIAFYTALGWRTGGSFTDTGPIWKSANLVMSFSLTDTA